MQKHINARHLSEIVAGLLIDPMMLGEDFSPEVHQSFMFDIGQLVANYCGGHADLVTPVKSDNDDYKDAEAVLMVSPDECLGSLNRNVWSYHDATEWQHEEVDTVAPLTDEERAETRRKLQHLLQEKSAESELVSSVLADFEIQDWRINEDGLGEEFKDTYRCIIQQSKPVNQVFFKMYPKSLDGLSDEICPTGLAGVLEVRNGRPALTLGMDENDLAIDVFQADDRRLFITSNLPGRAYRYVSDSHGGTVFDGISYQTGDSTWLQQARSEIADRIFTEFEFDHDLTVGESDGWSIEGDFWSKVIYFDNPTGGDSIKGHLELTFAKASPLVIQTSHG